MKKVWNYTAIEDIDNKGHIKRNLWTASLKDTVTVPDGGFTIIWFFTYNLGISTLLVLKFLLF